MYSYFATYPPNEKYSYVFSNYHYGDYPELHNHDFWEFSIIVKGSYEHTLNKKTEILAKNTAVLLRPQLDSHYIISNSPDGTILNIRLYTPFVKDFCSGISDTFYDDSNGTLKWAKMGVLGVEMESYALYCNALRSNKKALCICTVSDSIVHPDQITSAEERQTSFTKMMEIALELA
ncbi:MAG: AraC family ligand binding domain-containing protein [Clostridia bacterium]|nr:AraC family ligand binding domain-containing protein [Clostridia bacterium]